jgi:hypothetical protein
MYLNKPILFTCKFTTTRVEAVSIAMATRMEDTRVIRGTDIRAGGRAAAVAAGTAGDKTAAATTAGETPTRGGKWFRQLRPSPDCI